MKALAALALTALLTQVPAWDQPTLTVAPAPLTAAFGSTQKLGALSYAGGLYLTSSSSRLGGLSGLEARDQEDGSVLFHAVTDAGDFLEFRGHLDDRGRLTRVDGLKLAELRDSQGQPFPYKAAGDAEDLSDLPDRPGFLVSFEQQHRIVAYEDPFDPAGAQGRVELPRALEAAPANSGAEAIAALPGGAYAVGAEDGRIWLCQKAQACRQVSGRTPFGIGPAYTLSAFDHLSGGELIAIYRAKAVFAHWNAKIVHIRIVDGQARFTELADLRAHLGNMEGIAALPLRDRRGWRLYLVSDNGFEAREPTLLLAFDWRP